MKRFFVGLLLVSVCAMAQTSSLPVLPANPPAASSPAMAVAGQSAEATVLADYFKMLQADSKEHREFLAEYYKWVFAAFTVLATFFGAVIAFLTNDKLKWAAKRIDQLFDSKVEEKVQREVERLKQTVVRADGDIAQRIRTLEGVQTHYEKLITVTTKLSEGQIYHARRLYQLAASSFDEVLRLDPDHEIAKIGAATSLSYLQPPRYGDVLKRLDAVIDRNPRAGLALYNRACIRFIERKKVLDDPILRDLRDAFQLEEDYGETAKIDEDWDSVRADPRFDRLIKDKTPAATPSA